MTKVASHKQFFGDPNDLSVQLPEGDRRSIR